MGRDTLKFSLISDMHLNHPQLKTPYDLLEKNVVVAGDTSDGLEGLKFLQKLRAKDFTVAAVDGNHEHYANLSRGREWIETEASFVKDNPSDTELDGVPVVLKNGWYPVSDEHIWYHTMNDARYACLTEVTVNSIAIGHAKFIGQRLALWRNRGRKGVVVTHTAPCEDTLDPKFTGERSNEWYWNPYMRELIEEFSDQILVWCHGHTHSFADKIVGGVRVVCNPRGYPRENPNWKPFTVEV